MTQLGQALSDRFEEVSRTELVRLRRKMARLSVDDRAIVEALAVEVTHGIALRLDASLAVAEHGPVGEALAKIFALQFESSVGRDQVSPDGGDKLRNRT